METIDVLDENGLPTGLTKPKDQVHRDGDWHRAAHVWIVTDDGRVLLQKRAKAKENWPGWWDVSAAGHCSAGESALETAIRETDEELGLKLLAGDLQLVGTFRESVVLNEGRYLDNEIHEVFLARLNIDITTITVQQGEVDAVALVAVETLTSRPNLVPHAGEHALIRQLASART